MKIGVDFDDVLTDSTASFAQFHNRRYGTKLTRDDHTSWDLQRVWGIPREEMHARVAAWYASEEHARMQPVLGAKEVLSRLNNEHELHIVTGRSHKTHSVTSTLLDTFLLACSSSCILPAMLIRVGFQRLKYVKEMK